MVARISAKLGSPRMVKCKPSRSLPGALCVFSSRRAKKLSTTVEDRKHQCRGKQKMRPQYAQRPEEIDAGQEAEKQWRIAERRENAANICDEKYEEDNDMRLVMPLRVRLQERGE